MMTIGTGRPRGRPAKPTARKIQEGNPGKRVLPQSLIPLKDIRDTSIPQNPGLDEDGLKMWIRTWKAGAAWLDPEADYYVVKMMCEKFQEAEFLRKGIATGQFPRWYTAPGGQMISHPAFTQQEQALKSMASAMAAIGFTPADRARLEITIAEKQDEIDEIENDRKERNKMRMKEMEEDDE